jgi:mono/diheme cytochrome c family protein
LLIPGRSSEGVFPDLEQEERMKSKTWIFCLLVLGTTVSTAAQGEQVEKGKSLVEGKHCAICHKEGGKGKPIKELAGGKTDAFLKEALTDPKKAISPQVLMPPYKFTDEELQAVIDYLRSVSKK